MELKRAFDEASTGLAVINDATRRKKAFVSKARPNVADAAHFCFECCRMTQEDMLGPLLMYIDVPDPSHQVRLPS